MKKNIAFRIWITVLIILVMLVSCKNGEEELNYYLSITLSMEDEKSDTESGIIIANYIYDLKSDNIEKVETVIDYSSQYPLAVYNKYSNTIYYSERVYNENKYGDQLFSFNITTNEKEQLTDNLFAINYIIPTTNGIYIAAVKIGMNEIQVMYYSLNDKKLVESNVDSGLFFELLTYDPISGGVFGAA